MLLRARRRAFFGPIAGAVVGAVVPGVLCLVALALPMTTSGTGSSGSARDLADLVRSQRLDPFVAPAWGFWWYAVGLLGCVLVAMAGVGTSRVTLAVRGVLGAAIGLSAAWISWRLTSGDVSRLGPAAWCYFAASVLAVTAAVASRSSVVPRAQEETKR